MKTRGPNGGYDFDEKWFYRRWVWNRFRRMLTIPLSEARVLLMPSSSLGEIEVARKYGAVDEHLVAVDDNAANLATIRRKGYRGISVTAKVRNVFASSHGCRLDAAHLDFTGCWSDNMFWSLYEAGKFPSWEQCAVLIVNMQRGREGSGRVSLEFLSSQIPIDGAEALCERFDRLDVARALGVEHALNSKSLPKDRFWSLSDLYVYKSNKVTMLAVVSVLCIDDSTKIDVRNPYYRWHDDLMHYGPRNGENVYRHRRAWR